jgi:glycosyltransferase involved in cell wall biosynthesis
MADNLWSAMSQPVTFSVVTPSFNQASYLEETMLSVLNQDYPHVEYMVIDGASTDGCAAIIRKYAPRLKYWVSEPDRGQSDAINKGLARARGDVFAYLNSDDCYIPGALSRAAEILNAHPEAGVIYGNVRMVDVAGRDLPDKTYDARDFDLRTIREITSVIPQPAAFIRTEVLRRHGPFREDLNYVMDWEMWIRLALRGVKFHRTPDPLARFRIHEDAKTFHVSPANMAERARVLEEHGLHPNAPWRLEARELAGRLYWRAGEVDFRAGRYDEAGKYFVEGAKRLPAYAGSERIRVNLPLAMINRFGADAIAKIGLFCGYFSDDLMSAENKRILLAETRRFIENRETRS